MAIFGRLLAVTLILALGALPLRAEAVRALSEALRIERLLDIMQAEGLRYGADLEADLFPGSGGARWQAILTRIHDRDRMSERFHRRFAEALDGQDEAVAAMVGFFASGPGRQFVELELAAREALLDEAVTEAAEVAFDDMLVARDPRVRLLRRFAEVNDLIDSNVSGALNSNLAFYMGLVEGGSHREQIPEADILADVWAQEPAIRVDTEDWLFPYLTLAYRPVSDADLEAYIAFCETPEGRLLNAALFAGFDAMFRMLSHDLGHAAGQLMQGEDI